MSLVFDNRAILGNNPGLHAILIGVSSYPYLEGGALEVADPWQMAQLSSTASSAGLVLKWLRDADAQQRLPVPLSTCRVLASPGPAEQAVAGSLRALTDQVAAELNAWRDDCKTNRKHVALFYFAGHGVQRMKEDAVLCLEDFRKPGSGMLAQSIAIANIRGGMAPAPGFDDIARTQLYFVDACRVRPEYLSRFEAAGVRDVFDVDLAGADDRCSPIFFAAISNATTDAIPNQQSLFSLALLDCLDGDAGVPLDEETPQGDVVWGVTVESLNQQLCTTKLDQINRDYGADQTYAPGGQMRPAVICRLAAPPLVPVRLSIDPPEASEFAMLEIDGPKPAPNGPFKPHPLDGALPGGIYSFKVTFAPGQGAYRSIKREWQIKPLRFQKALRVV